VKLKELLEYYRALAQLLVATNLQSIERWKEFREAEEGVGYEK